MIMSFSWPWKPSTVEMLVVRWIQGKMDSLDLTLRTGELVLPCLLKLCFLGCIQGNDINGRLEVRKVGAVEVENGFFNLLNGVLRVAGSAATYLAPVDFDEHAGWELVVVSRCTLLEHAGSIPDTPAVDDAGGVFRDLGVHAVLLAAL